MQWTYMYNQIDNFVVWSKIYICKNAVEWAGTDGLMVPEIRTNRIVQCIWVMVTFT